MTGRRCDSNNLGNNRLFGEDQDGVYGDVEHRCMLPSCDRCWKPLHNRRIWAARLALTKLGISNVWLGLLSSEDRRTARHFKERHTDDIPPVLYMLSTYYNSDLVGVLSTANMVPSREVMEEAKLEDGLYRYHYWGTEYRPKRVRADWALTLPSSFKGLFTASPSTIRQMWAVLSHRYGYKPGEVPEDPIAFERRMYTVLEELKAK